MSAHLDGNVTLQHAHPVNLVVRFFTPNTDTEVHKSAAITDSAGNFDVYDVPVGTYDVGIKSDHSLSVLAEDKVFSEGQTTQVSFGTLWLGDLNHDDYVTLSDRTLLYAAMYEEGDCAGYAGDWLLPECPSPPPAGGACYGYVIS